MELSWILPSALCSITIISRYYNSSCYKFECIIFIQASLVIRQMTLTKVNEYLSLPFFAFLTT